MKILFLRHKYVTLLAGAALSVAVFAAAAMPAAVSASTTERQLPIYCVNRDQKVCAISFDAAWGDASTQSLVDILNQYNVKATFFVIGNWAEQYPEDVKMLKENGMEVMNHSSAHGHMNQMSSEEIIADIKKCNDQIEALTVECPTLFRAPYGEYDDHVIAAVRSIGMEPIQWDVDSLDWKDYGVDSIVKAVLDNKELKNGSIILCHNGAKYTADALESVITGLQEKGYELVSVSELIYKDHYHMDVTGRQIKD